MNLPDDDFVLKEGDYGIDVILQATAPPRILGAGILKDDIDSWTVTVDFDYGVEDPVLRCPSGVEIPQVVLSVHVKDSPSIKTSCQINIDASNWNSVYVLNLKAVADNKIDGDKTGYINMTFSYNQNNLQNIKFWEVTKKVSLQ